MTFTRKPKNEGDPNSKIFAVHMTQTNKTPQYVCDMIDDNGEEADAVNNLGLTLRTRLVRSKGDYAMLEGSIFNPNKLLIATVNITDLKVEQIAGGIKDGGHALLTVTADGCVNKYIIFNPYTLSDLERKFKAQLKKR